MWREIKRFELVTLFRKSWSFLDKELNESSCLLSFSSLFFYRRKEMKYLNFHKLWSFMG